MKFSGVVLCGGKSSRYGANKAFEEYNNKELIRYSLDILEQFTDKIYISGDYELYKHYNKVCIPDIIKGIGPIGGIYSCLDYCDSDSIIFLTCDMPFVNKEVIGRLIDFHTQVSDEKEGKATIYKFDNKYYPFPGIYDKSLLNRFKESIDIKNYKLTDALNNSINPVELNIKDYYSLTNINYVNDLELYGKIQLQRGAK